MYEVLLRSLYSIVRSLYSIVPLIPVANCVLVITVTPRQSSSLSRQDIPVTTFHIPAEGERDFWIQRLLQAMLLYFPGVFYARDKAVSRASSAADAEPAEEDGGTTRAVSAGMLCIPNFSDSEEAPTFLLSHV